MLKVRCPAKVNLYLNTVRKNPDGFHELESLFHTIDFCDYLNLKTTERNFELTFSPKSTIQPVTVSYNLLENNFLERVFYDFQEEFDIPNLKVEIEKHIPVGAGLGGGSSDTAGFIIALNKCFQLGLTEQDLHQRAARYGSDTPFFLTGGLAYITGRGEKILTSPLPLPSRFEGEVIILYPDLAISTAEAYRENNVISSNHPELPLPNFDHLKDQLTILLKNKDQDNKVFEFLVENSYNSFQKKSLERYPELQAIFDKIRDYPTFPLLSGSGSSIFLAYHDKITVRKVVNLLQDEGLCVASRWLPQGASIL